MLSFLPNRVDGTATKDNFASLVAVTRSTMESEINYIAGLEIIWTVIHQPGAANCIQPVKPNVILTTDLILKRGFSAKITI